MKRTNLILTLITSGLLCAPVAAQVGKKGEAPTAPTPVKTGTQPKKTTAPARPARSTTSTGRRTNSTPAKSAPAKDTSVEVAYWETIKNSADPEDFRGYLRDYPAGKFVTLARNRLNALEAKKAPVSGPADGLVTPITSPATGAPAATSPAASTTTTGALPPGTMPSVDQLLERAIQAVGGRDAWARQTSYIVKGVEESDGSSTPFETYVKAPNKMLSIGKDFRLGYDGSIAWVQNDKGTFQLNGPLLAAVKRDAEFYGDMKLKELYSQMAFAGTEKVNNRETYVVEALMQEGGTKKLYYDASTGLLIRVYEQSSVLPPQQIDFSDFRRVNGLLMPFASRHTSEGKITVRTVSQVSYNVPIDDSIFSPKR